MPLETYYETKAQALEAVKLNLMDNKGVVFQDQDEERKWWDFVTYGTVPYEQNASVLCGVLVKGKKRGLFCNLYRMQSGRYEVVAYVN